MRVTHIITRLIVGGAQENTVATVLGLARRPGVAIDLISGPTRGPEGSLERCFEKRPELLTLSPNLVRPIHPWRDALAYRQLALALRERRPDVVHTHSGKAGVLGRLAARRTKVPVVVHTVHGPSFGPFQGAFANFAFTQAERLVAGATTRFVSVAEAMTRTYLAAGVGRREQYTCIRSGFELEPFRAVRRNAEARARLGLEESDFVVGKIARLFKLKGHDDLFAVAPGLMREIPNLKLLLVGDGPWRQRFEDLARALRVRDRVVFSGLVAPEEVPSLVAQMDVLVHLSRREGLPRALPQAMASGKPVVAYDCDGAGEVCRSDETGFLVPPGDRTKLQEAVLKLAKDPALQSRLGRAGQRLAEREFALDRMLDALHDLYRALLEGASPA
jgi:glycosyltransferase involved in cell wall biosynthesis